MSDFFDQEPSPVINRRKNRRKQLSSDKLLNTSDILSETIQKDQQQDIILPPPSIFQAEIQQLVQLGDQPQPPLSTFNPEPQQIQQNQDNTLPPPPTFNHYHQQPSNIPVLVPPPQFPAIQSSPVVKHFEEEQIPSVDEIQREPSASFDCFAPHATIQKQEHSTFSAGDISVQQQRQFIVTELSNEMEFADDKTEKQNEAEVASQQNEENEQLKGTVQQYKQQVSNAQIQIAELRKIAEELKNSNSVLNETNIDLNHSLQNFQHQYQDLSNQNSSLQQEINSLLSQISEFGTGKQSDRSLIRNLEISLEESQMQRDQLALELKQIQSVQQVKQPVEPQYPQPIKRPKRRIRVSQVFEDVPDLFPLNFNTNAQQILSFLDINIAKERQTIPNALPTYRALTLAALRWKLIQTSPELAFLKSSDFLFQELLLEDFSDNQIHGSVTLDLEPLNDIKLKLATGKFEEAAIAAQNAGFFGVSQLIAGVETDAQKVASRLPECCSELMELVSMFRDLDGTNKAQFNPYNSNFHSNPQQFNGTIQQPNITHTAQSNSDSTHSDNQNTQNSNNNSTFHSISPSVPFHTLALTISQISHLSFSELKYRFANLIQSANNDLYLQQIILITASIPCHFNANFEFSFLKTGKSQTPSKPTHFHQFLQKMQKEFQTPPLEDFRLTEIYEFTFAKQNLGKVGQRMLCSFFTVENNLDDLTYNNTQQAPSNVLSYLSFFPHLLAFKAAFCGLSRKQAQQSKQIARQALFYAEILIKNITFLIQFQPENLHEMENEIEDEFSVYEVAVLPLKITEQTVRYPIVSASFQIWTGVGRAVSSYKKELKNMLQDNCSSLFAGDQSQMDLFYGKEVEIQVDKQEEEENEFFDAKSEEMSGLEVNEEFEVEENLFENPYLASASSKRLEKVATQELIKLQQVAENIVFQPVFTSDQPEIQLESPCIPEPVFMSPQVVSADEPTLFADFAAPSLPVIPQANQEQVQLTKESSQNDFFAPSTSKSSKNEIKDDKKQEETIKADPGKKLSKKWSSVYKRWVMVGEDGKEIAPEEDAIPPPPPSLGVPPPSIGRQEQQTQQRRGAAGRYKSVQ
ncbi:hypothetical protein SS50377_24319 [Spironucleus salmonicida]|uniref:Uncharacterized protein n=1 Tax=Spironucleus salmonicida TaxID=348837 RepID=V6LPG0_9EUKA|nr:hypothetical protein SS50377_24319 [Spironucleus salmonicida]|eukprot:EST46128.1 Hypothetical protein SS50377_14125 [Spironucleus salmonicida]